MLKIIKFSRNLVNLGCFRYSSSSRYQFKTERPVYYPKRILSDEDAIKASLQVQEQTKKALVPATDYYKILGVKKTASAQEIKGAYYELAKKYHPDATPTPQETKSFQEISDAYHVLTDDTTRQEYDKYGFVKSVGSNEVALSDTTNKDHKDGPKIKANFLKYFQKEKGETDVQNLAKNEVEMDLNFLQAIQGTTEYITLKAMVKCPRCNGTTKTDTKVNIEFCHHCGGTGQYRVKSVYKVCDYCEGKRYVHKNSCKTCENLGFITKSRRVEVKVPPGAAHGDLLKLVNPLNNQLVKIRLNVLKSSYFKRDGNNISTEKYLTISQAVLGGKFKIRGLYGDMELNLGPGIESHTTHCFKGKGIINNTGLSGDHTVTFKIRIPRNLTTKQRQLMLALARTEDPLFDGQ